MRLCTWISGQMKKNADLAKQFQVPLDKEFQPWRSLTVPGQGIGESEER